MSIAVNDIEEVVKVVLFRSLALSNRVSELEEEKASLEKEKGRLETDNAVLESEKALLEARINKLEKSLSPKTPEKDSHNSSVPPSKENLHSQAVRRTRSLREPSGRHTGGQPGHKGSTLTMSDSADATVVHSPEYCEKCGNSLAGIEGEAYEVRQSIDIPLPICPVATNHVCVEKKCTCGHCNRGAFPAYVKPGASYGVNIHALVVYLSTVQHIPFKRLTGILKDIYGINISQGSISNILNRMRKQAEPAYEAIRGQVEKSPVVGADETGSHVDGKLHWMWTFQNDLVTYFFHDQSRGKAAIDKHFPGGLPKSLLVTDRHSPYFNMEVAAHQVCLAHLLRELIYLEELDKGQKWSSDMLELLRDSIHQKKILPFSEIDIGKIKQRFEALAGQDLRKLDAKFQSLQKSLTKHADHLFQFLEHIGVPYDNNASERSIRPTKIKMKVSGMFKSNNGADDFCTLHSIVETARKNGQDPFLALIAVAENVISL